MVYVGTSLVCSNGYGQDGCLINPSLPVAAGPPDAMTYWPSYAQISAQNRHAYLTWLGSGKTDACTDIGYVFLYFYGIERRLIVDRPGKDEAHALMAELVRLLSIYGENGSFHGYATRLLATARFLYDPPTEMGEPDPLADDFTVDRQAAFATFCRDGKPISFAWAALRHKEHFAGTDVWRKCPTDFLALARQQFETAYPNGLIQRLPSSVPFKYVYSAANRSVAANFDDIIKARFGPNLPSVNQGTPAEISECFRKPAARLKRYAEFLAVHPGTESSPLALARLPAEIRESRLAAAEASFKAWADGLIADAKGLVLLETLWSRLYGKTYWAYDKSSWEDLAKQLQRFRYGLIPDPLFNEIPHLRPDQPVVLYTLEKDNRTAPRPDFITGQAIAFICAEYGRQSGTSLPPASLQRLSESLTALGLSAPERTRTLASLPWYETQGLIRGRLKKTLDRLVPPRRPTVLTAAAGILGAAGADSGQLVAFLEKLCGMLDVERSVLYSVLHQSSGASAPVAPAGANNVVPIRTGYAIPKPPAATSKGAQGATLDPSRIKSVLVDTQQAFDALSDVLEDDEPPPPEKPSIPISDLDAGHATLLDRLLEKPSWTRDAFEAVTHELGLMPDGALETLNDWSFDHFDEALIDEGDPLTLNPSCVEALLARNAEKARA
jgi:hypothetical protein